MKNEYKNMGEYYIGYSQKNKEEFYFDSKYYEVVKNHNWRIKSDRGVMTKINNHDISITKILFGDKVFGYINGNQRDVRENNLKDVRGFKNNGKVHLNGYIAIYMPEHPRAFNNGCVYEHVLVAEKMLGRSLNDKECVHHINRNRTDNRSDNLMVFATNEDHLAFHGGGEAVLTENGNYITKRKRQLHYLYVNRTAEDIKNDKSDKGSIRISQMELCPVCNKNFKYIRSEMCQECHHKLQAMNIPSKEELEKLIYTESFVAIGRKYGVSDSAVRKWCKKYELPYRRKDIDAKNSEGRSR